MSPASSAANILSTTGVYFGIDFPDLAFGTSLESWPPVLLTLFHSVISLTRK